MNMSQVGFVGKLPPSQFQLDPVIKENLFWLSGNTVVRRHS